MTGLVKCLLKHRIRCEMTSLLYKIVNENSDVTVPVNSCVVDAKRLTNLENQMSVVRNISNDWSALMRLCINKGESISVTIKKILDLMTEGGTCIRITDILCMCTYVSDLCVFTMSSNDQGYVCEIIETLVDYLIDKNIVMCIKFLHYIDDL